MALFHHLKYSTGSVLNKIYAIFCEAGRVERQILLIMTSIQDSCLYDRHEDLEKADAFL